MFSDKAKKSKSKDREITYIPVKQGFLYLVAIMDWATRKVLYWRLSNTPDAKLTVSLGTFGTYTRRPFF